VTNRRIISSLRFAFSCWSGEHPHLSHRPSGRLGPFPPCLPHARQRRRAARAKVMPMSVTRSDIGQLRIPRKSCEPARRIPKPESRCATRQTGTRRQDTLCTNAACKAHPAPAAHSRRRHRLTIMLASIFGNRTLRCPVPFSLIFREHSAIDDAITNVAIARRM
jgi:hypothetical protein